MANFNIGIDCPVEEAAKQVYDFVEALVFYRDGLVIDEERVSLVSKQGLLGELKKYASERSVELGIEMWPEGMDYDEAEAAGELEFKKSG